MRERTSGYCAAKKKRIDEQPLAARGVDTTTTSKYTKFELPPARKGGAKFVADVNELVSLLKSEAKVL